CLFSNLSGVNTGFTSIVSQLCLYVKLPRPPVLMVLHISFPCKFFIKAIPERCPPEFPPADNVLTIGVFDSLSVVLKSSSLKGNTFGLLLPSRCPIRYIRSLFWGKNHDVLSNCHSSL